tara:strand:+ start:710 stop:1975 length:1266 start_codon:yes stop_codon:yes gene_type:complete
MAYGSTKSISDSILAATDGESIQEQIDAYMQSSASGTTGDGLIAAATINKDTDAAVSAMRKKSLGARESQAKAQKAVVNDKLASVGRDWMALLKGVEEVDAPTNASFRSDLMAASSTSAPETTDEEFLQTGVLPVDRPDVLTPDGSDNISGSGASIAEGRFDGATTPATTSLMSRPTVDNVDAIEAHKSDVKKQTNAFYLDIGENAESDHGSTPVLTADSREENLADADKSMDIGFGHKIVRGGTEDTSGMIHGIKYKEADGTYIALTKEQKVKILNEDMAVNLVAARKDYTKADGSVAKGWDSKLKDLGTSWDDLDFRYQNALTSLAYNVGGKKAATQWKAVLKAAKEKDIGLFAKELRREDGGSRTAGMDNRVAKELYYAGLIKNLSELNLVWTEKVKGVNVTRSNALPLVTSGSGVPA